MHTARMDFFGKTVLCLMVAPTKHGYVMATVVDDGDDTIYIDIDGHKFSSKDLPAGKPESRRQWALSQALAYAKAKPELNLSASNVTELAEQFLAWLDQKPTESPGKPKGGSGITFA